MPLADVKRGVARGAKDLRRRGGFLREISTIAGKATVLVRQQANPGRVRVQSRQQRGSGRCTDGGGSEIDVADASCTEPVDIGCADIAAVTAEICEPKIINEDDHYIGSAVGRWR